MGDGSQIREGDHLSRDSQIREGEQLASPWQDLIRIPIPSIVFRMFNMKTLVAATENFMIITSLNREDLALYTR